jgi:hypothetical protein
MGATVRTVDLSNVKEGGNFNKSRIPAGDYAAKIVKVEDAVAKDKTPQYLFTIQIVGHSSTKLPYYCKLQENQLWKLRNIFIAAGKVVPKKKIQVNPNQIVGKMIGVTIEDAEFENKEQSEIAGVFPSAELGDDAAVSNSGGSDDEDGDDEDLSDAPDDDEDEAAPAAEADEDEAEEEPEEAEEEAEEEEADPYADLDRAAIKARIKAAQPDFKVLTRHTDDDLRDALRTIDAASDEPAEEAAPPAAKAKRAPKTPTAGLSDDDLDDLDIDNI